ncbi:MAG: hypothetical protein NTX03_05265 [Bacteroidetes bacterium]|nr:hypothetical protein [Bacteroidota bacterium]
MRKIIVLFLLFITSSIFAQTKSRVSINGGFCATDLYSKFFIWRECDEGCHPTEQRAKLLIDTKVLFEISLGKGFYIPIGFGCNQKGFSEKGLINNGAGTYSPYSYSFVESFIGSYIGLSYDLLRHAKYSINFSQLFNPEIAIDAGILNPPYTRYRILYSTQTNLSFQYDISDKLGFRLTPFFQTSLSAYETVTLYFSKKPSYWSPYGVGLTFGLLL